MQKAGFYLAKKKYWEKEKRDLGLQYVFLDDHDDDPKKNFTLLFCCCCCFGLIHFFFWLKPVQMAWYRLPLCVT